jgi:hypothetical protein
MLAAGSVPFSSGNFGSGVEPHELETKAMHTTLIIITNRFARDESGEVLI